MSEHRANIDAVRALGNADDAGPLVLTCEHAGNLIPSPLEISREEGHWLDTHWGYDIGAAAVVESIVARTRSVAVLALFSRLLCDPNRPWGHPECIRQSLGGRKLLLNDDISAEELGLRQELYEQYHTAVDSLLVQRKSQRRSFMMLALHSFTPVYDGQQRPMEIGVLFDQQHVGLAKNLAQLLSTQGFRVALNEPYSGYDGLIYSVARHGVFFRVPYLEIEVRQDLLLSETQTTSIATRIADALVQLPNE